MENYTSGTATEKSPDSQKKKKSHPLAFHGFKGCKCFSLTLLKLSRRPAESKKNLLFFCTNTQFLLEHPSLGMIWIFFVAFSSSCTFWVKQASVWFDSDYKNICVPTGGCIFIQDRASGAASWSNHTHSNTFWRFICQGSQRLRCRLVTWTCRNALWEL